MRDQALLSPIIDADGHYVEDVGGWAANIAPGARHAAPRLMVDDDGIERFSIGDLYCLPPRGRNPMGRLSMGDGMTPRRRDGDAPDMRGRRVAEAAPGGLDPHARLRVMDEEGIDVSVLFPTFALAALPALADAKVASALAAALNDWVVERFCSANPDRLVPVATIPLHDPAFAAREIERCATQLGMRSAWVSPMPVMGRTIDDPAHDLVWERAAALDVAIITHHGSGGGGVRALGRDRNATWLGSHAMGHCFEAMAAIVGLYTSRVFQRFPQIRWGFMEAGCGWLPFWLEQIHEHAERMMWLVPDLPDDDDITRIFRDRCLVTAENDDPFVGAAFDAGGDRSVVWASDYPHFDCAMPGVTEPLRTRPDLSAERRRAFAGLNAIAFYRLRTGLLQGV